MLHLQWYILLQGCSLFSLFAMLLSHCTLPVQFVERSSRLEPRCCWLFVICLSGMFPGMFFTILIIFWLASSFLIELITGSNWTGGCHTDQARYIYITFAFVILMMCLIYVFLCAMFVFNSSKTTPEYHRSSAEKFAILRLLLGDNLLSFAHHCH